MRRRRVPAGDRQLRHPRNHITAAPLPAAAPRPRKWRPRTAPCAPAGGHGLCGPSGSHPSATGSAPASPHPRPTAGRAHCDPVAIRIGVRSRTKTASWTQRWAEAAGKLGRGRGQQRIQQDVQHAKQKHPPHVAGTARGSQCSRRGWAKDTWPLLQSGMGLLSRPHRDEQRPEQRLDPVRLFYCCFVATGDGAAAAAQTSRCELRSLGYMTD